MANYFDQFDIPSADVGPPQGVGRMGPNTRYTPEQMAQLNAARDALRAAEARGDPGTYGAENKPQGNYFDQFDSTRATTKTDEYSPMQAAVIGAGRELTQLGRGVQQAYYGLTGDQAAQAALKAKSDEESRLYQPLQENHPIATAVGEGAPVVFGGPATMAAAGALEYGTPEEKATRAAAGYVGGKLGQYGGQLIGRVAQPIRGAANDLVDATKAAFDRFGAPVLPGQITQSVPLQWLESAVASLPGGARVRAVQAAQQGALNKGLMDVVGSTADAVTPETTKAALRSSGSEIGNLSRAVPQVDLSTNNYQVFRELNAVKQRYLNKLDSLQRPVVQNLIDDIEKQGNSMTGEFYQNTRSDLGSMIRGASGSLENALSGIQGALDRAFDRSAPEEVVKAVKTARTRYRLGLDAEKMATETGDVSPVRVANAFKDETGDARQLARMASTVKPMRSSGSAERLFYQSLLSGGVGAGTSLASGDPTDAFKYGAGAFIAPWAASQLLTRSIPRAYLTNTSVSPLLYSLLGRAGSVGGGLLGMSTAR